jgi:hypothetical protein
MNKYVLAILALCLIANSSYSATSFVTGYVVGSAASRYGSNMDSTMMPYFDGVLTCSASYKSASYGYLIDGCQANFLNKGSISVTDYFRRYVPRGKIVSMNFIYSSNRIEIYFIRNQ